MSVLLAALNQGTLGIHPRSIVVKCESAETSTTIAATELVRFDFTQASAEPGQGNASHTAPSTSKFAVIRLASAAAPAGTLGGIYGVAMQSIGPGKSGDVLICGVATVKTASATYTQGETVGLPTSSGTAGVVTKSSVSLKIGTVLSTTDASATSAQIILDGSIKIH